MMPPAAVFGKPGGYNPANLNSRRLPGEEEMRKKVACLALAALLMPAVGHANHHDIKAFADRFAKAWNDGADEALEDMWLPGGYLLTLEGDRLRGDQIEEYFERRLQADRGRYEIEGEVTHSPIIGEWENDLGSVRKIEWTARVGAGKTATRHKVVAVGIKSFECLRFVSLQMTKVDAAAH